METPHPVTFGIFGHYGNENMGDEAIVAAVKEEILSRYPDTRIFGFSIVPEDTHRRHGIESFPIRRLRGAATADLSEVSKDRPATISPAQGGFRQTIKRLPIVYPAARAFLSILRGVRSAFAEIGFLRRSYRILKQVDLLMVAGSGQLTDLHGVWGFPYTLYKWSLLASWSGCQLVCIGVGAGPLIHPLSKWFIKQTLRKARYRSYRDESSYQLISALGIGKNDPVCPDLAFGKRVAEPIFCEREKLVVGINPMAYHDPRYWPNASAAQYETYLGKLKAIITWVAEQGHSVVLFPTQLRADVLVIRELLSALDRTCPPIERARITSVAIDGLEAQLGIMATFDLIIATRFHGVLMSYLVGKPTIAISYHPKMHDLTAYMGHPECALPVDTLDVEAVKRTFIQLAARLRSSREIITARRIEQKKALAVMYDKMFAAVMP